MSRPSARLLATLAASFLVTVSSAAHADRSAEERAEAKFQEGRTLLERGQLVEACQRLAESAELARSGRTTLNLAECLERRGLLASAQAKFLEVAQIAVDANRPDAERHARERARRLEARVPRIAVVVPKDLERPDLEVRFDGRVLDRDAASSVVPVDPGTTHTIEASSEGKTFSRTVTAAEGKNLRVVVEWAGTTPAAGVESSAAAEPAKPTSPGASRPLAYGALGLGVVGLGVGAFATAQFLSAQSTVEAHCDQADRTCDQEGLDAAGTGKTYGVVAPVAFGVGAVAVAAGAFLLLRSTGDRSKSVAVSPAFAPGSASVVLGGRF